MSQQISLDINTFHSSKDSLPTLFKNHRITRGLHYSEAVRAAVIAKPSFPYTPTEPPAILSEIVESEPLYVCFQCKDRFRFKSSFDDHINRRSWILGLWCQMCFIICTHKTAPGVACPLCLKKDKNKRTYLKIRGYTKNKKMGAIKVFYNQCQFFKHLETHKSMAVDLGDLMLMPLPVALRESDWSSELEVACEALLEHAFLSRVHINDWLKKNDIENTWWNLSNDKNNDTPIHNVINRYRVFKTFDESDHFPNTFVIDPPFSVSVSSNKSHNYSQVTNSNSSTHRNTSGRKDNSCTNDIAFVDCGQATHDFMPESATSCMPEERETVAKPSQQVIRMVIPVNSLQQPEQSTNDNCENESVSNSNQKFIGESSESDTAQQYIKCNTVQLLQRIKITATSGNITAAPSNEPASDIPARMTNNATSITNNSPKIVAIQVPKNITSILDHMSPSLASNNKIVILGNDIDKILAGTADGVPTKTTCKSNNGNTSLQTCDAGITKQKNEDQIIVRNGKKYLIKKIESGNSVNKSKLPVVPKAIKTPADNTSTTSTDKAIDSKAADNGGETALSDNTACVTRPASSETSIGPVQKSTKKSSTASRSEKKRRPINSLRKIPGNRISSATPRKCRTIETITLVPGDTDRNVYMRTELLDRDTLEYRFTRVCHSVSEMMEDFGRMGICELEERVYHLKSVKEELKSVLSFMPSGLVKKQKKANILLQALDRCRREREGDDEPEIGAPGHQGDPRLADWETVEESRAQCAECDKPGKPDAYIPGFSKLAVREFDYCLCYKQVCHECRAYVDAPSRFIQHRDFHRRRPPHVCPDCQTAFPSAVSLEAHAWTVCFHALRKRFFCCRICEIDGFRDMESVTRHYVVMHSATRTACDVCTRVFSTYSECVDHCSRVHSVQCEPVRLVECKASDVTVRWENYMTYLGDFRGVRKVTYFKCPFCPLKTVVNKHAATLMNRHIRSLHVANLARAVSSEVFSEIFNTKPTTRDGKADVVSTADLKPPTPEEGIVLPATNCESLHIELGKIAEKDADRLKAAEETKMEVDAFESEKTEATKPADATKSVKVEEKKADQLKAAEKTKMEMDTSKPKYAEETEATETPDAITNDLVTPSNPETPPSASVDDVRVSLPSEEDSYLRSEASTTPRIKVVDIRKISKPDVAPLAETRDARTENTSSDNRIPELPPLVKIPQRIIDAIEAAEPGDYSGNVATSRDPAPAVAGTRIAIHGTRDGDVEYACHLCGERITTSRSVVRRHFGEKHSDECTLAAFGPRAMRICPADFVNGDYKALTSGEKRKADSNLQPPLFVAKRKRRRTTKK